MQIKLIMTKEIFLNKSPSAKEVKPKRVLKNPNPSYAEAELARDIIMEGDDDKFNKLFTNEIAPVNKQKYYEVYKPYKCIIETKNQELYILGINKVLTYLKGFYIVTECFFNYIHCVNSFNIESIKNNDRYNILHNDTIQLYREMYKENFAIRKLSKDDLKQQLNIFNNNKGDIK